MSNPYGNTLEELKHIRDSINVVINLLEGRGSNEEVLDGEKTGEFAPVSSPKKLGRPPRKSMFNKAPQVKKRANKLIMRDFDLEDKEIKLMRTYLAGWTERGLVSADQKKALDSTLGILKELTDGQREQIREIFYDVRGILYSDDSK